MNTLLYGLLVLLVAGFFQGSFGLGMKEYKPFSWEAFWAVYSILAMVVIPVIWTGIEVPNFMEFISATPSSVLLGGAVCGFAWGVTAIGFGKAIDMIGMSLTYGIAMGVSAAVGSLIPLLAMATLPNTNVLIGILVGTVVMLVGVVIITKAGIKKEEEQNSQQNVSKSDSNMKKGFKVGLILAVVAGLGSAAQNIGFTFAGQVSDLAVSSGVNPTSASLIAWLVVFSGGFIANFAYAVYLLIKNKTYTEFTKKGAGNAYVKALITSLMWFAALGIYGKATAILGPLGPVVGWIGFNALALIISNAWGLKTGEWEGSIKGKKILLYGNLVLICSWVIVGIANSIV